MPSVVSRLLTPTVVARREIGTRADDWSLRLTALATLAQYDALTFVVDAPSRDRYAYNVADDPLADGATSSAIEETRRSGATVQTKTTLRLADDRVAATAMIAPLVATDAVSGVLVALRVGRSFAAADALTASGVSELVALELARETAARRDEAHRRQAFALYELARLALFGEHFLETLQDLTVLLTGSLDHDVAQIWLFDPDGALELSAAKPHENLRFELLRPAEHDVLAEALHQQRLVRVGNGALRPWVSAETREVMVVPLGDRGRSLGVLVLGRARDRYTEADEELASLLGRFISRLVAKAAVERGRAGAPDADADQEWENEPQLTGS
jgi:GTP-sensing pleiotropic transcriptional regulator CodY